MLEKINSLPLIRNLWTGSTIPQFKRYLITGFLSFGLEYTVFYLLYDICFVQYILANTFAIVVVFWFNFLMNRYWTFKSKQKLLTQLPRYGLIFIFNICISNLFMYLLSGVYGVSPLISKVLVMGLIVMWTFLIYKNFIYND